MPSYPKSPITLRKNSEIVFQTFLDKYTIKVGDNTGYQAIEALLVHNSINSIITVYGSLSTTGLDLVSLNSVINAGNVQLLATALNTGTSLNLMGTYVPD